MRMNALIPLQGQYADPVGAFARGQGARAQSDEYAHLNALRGAYKQHGGAAMQGDQNALAAIAQYDPAQAMGLRTAQHGMKATDARLGIAREEMELRRQQAAQQAKVFAMQVSEAERAEAAAKLEPVHRLLGFAVQSPEHFAQAQQQAPELLGNLTFDQATLEFIDVDEVWNVVSQRDKAPTLGSQQILEDGTIIQSTSAGPKVFSPTGEELSGEAAAGAIRTAREFEVSNQREINKAREGGKLNAQVELGGTAAGAVEGGKIAANMGAEAFQSYQTAIKAVSAMDEAIQAIDDGASSGMVQKYLPNVSLASASLQNAMDRMGLDVIGSVTFGALSEAEMKFALEVAAPRNLEPPELRKWLSRKRDAQEKAAEALYAAGRYLSTPGNTLAGWMDAQKGAGKKIMEVDGYKIEALD